MKHTTRGAVTAALACAAAACAASTAAADSAAVPVPLDGVKHSLGVQTPEISSTLPVPLPGGEFEGPRYVEGKLLPERVVPQIPVSNVLPDVEASAPLTDVVGEDSLKSVDLAARGSELYALTPGASAEAPLGMPGADGTALPPLTLPGAGLHQPLLSAAPGADLGLT
ncbi:hypothetical protein RB200_09745 [Streptomyces sp. PmtG]